MACSIYRCRRRKKYFDREGNFLLRQYTTTDLCKLYNISFPTFRQQFKLIKERTGKKQGYFFSVKQVKIIIKAWGVPHWREE